MNEVRWGGMGGVEGVEARNTSSCYCSNVQLGGVGVGGSVGSKNHIQGCFKGLVGLGFIIFSFTLEPLLLKLLIHS